MLSTENMGGVTVTPQQLAEMHAGDYILHARGGKLTKVPVEKIQLPVDPEVENHQVLSMVAAPDGTLYAAQQTVFSKSTDGGRTWTHKRCGSFNDGGFNGMNGFGQVVNKAGEYLYIRGVPFQGATIRRTDDDGENWRIDGKIDTGFKGQCTAGNAVRLFDGTLLMPVQVNEDFETSGEDDADGHWGRVIRGCLSTFMYRSKDDGRTFPYRSFFGDWCHEIGAAQLPSGRILAAIRYQRPRLPEDSPDLCKQTGSPGPFPYKHVFLADSDDGGLTWNNLRQLTTVFGQSDGWVTPLNDNRVVVCHDHRYPREMGSGRAMVSYDGATTFEDEVYYLCHGAVAGHMRSVTLDGQEMLAMGGAASEVWAAKGTTRFSIIRWKLQT